MAERDRDKAVVEWNAHAKSVWARWSAGAPSFDEASGRHVDVHVARPAPTSCVDLQHNAQAESGGFVARCA